MAKAILTANTEILPWPSLFKDRRKKMVLFRVLPIKIVDIFYSVEIVGYMVACVMQTHLEKVVNTISYTSLFCFSRDIRISYFIH